MSPVMRILVKLSSKKKKKKQTGQTTTTESCVCVYKLKRQFIIYMWWKRDEGRNDTKIKPNQMYSVNTRKHQKPTTTEQIWNLYIYSYKLNECWLVVDHHLYRAFSHQIDKNSQSRCGSLIYTRTRAHRTFEQSF